MEYRQSRPLSLKQLPEFNEKWLQDRIIEDPSLLGLGDVQVRASEVRQSAGGRLEHSLRDPENNLRCEVEIQLGATDPSHIIRTIEYWDVEGSRYRQSDEVNALVDVAGFDVMPYQNRWGRYQILLTAADLSER